MDRLEFDKMKTKIKDFFATATDEEMAAMLERTGYEFYKNVGEPLSALDEGWSDEVPTVPGMYTRAWKVAGYWQYSVEQMADGVFAMEGNGHKYTAGEIFEGCRWFGPFTPPQPEGE